MSEPDYRATSGSSSRKKRIRAVFIGWGAINKRVGAQLAQRNSAVEIVGIAAIHRPESMPYGATFLKSSRDLASVKPDIVIEAAGRAAIDTWAEPALAAASVMIIASTTAFCDETLMARLSAVAEKHGSRILIPSGAIGAIDALAGASILNLDEVTHQIVKPPIAWRGTPAEKLLDLATLNARTVFF